MVSRHHKLFWGSSYDRGLDILLYMWLDVKRKYPDAELHITYGWDLFDKVASNNPERMKWKDGVQKLMQQDGIIHHGRVGKGELKRIRQSCGIWAYPTYFQEINCITALDCQQDGVVPVTVALAALPETVQSGILVDGDINEPKMRERFLKELLGLMGDKKRWKKESIKGKKKARKYYWDRIAKQWDKVLKKPISTPTVIVITITIREGWWDLMARNISKQSYLVNEWIIVDDHPDDRSELAKEVAKDYNLNIKYLRGNKGKHRYGLAAANNIGWKNATGDLLVYLQDFVVMPQDGVESLVDIYRHHPNALIAPVDIYYECVEPNLEHKRTWWPSEGVIQRESWRNIRVINKGIRDTDNPADFEMNYGAIPKKVLDKLNGFWEFYDNGFGFDNTEIAYRHLENNGEIILDDTNICKCINLWPWIGGKKENVIERNRHQGHPFYKWMILQMERGKLPIIRDEKVDKSIHIDFSVPKEISDLDAPNWTSENSLKIMKKWKDL